MQRKNYETPRSTFIASHDIRMLIGTKLRIR